MDAEIAAEKEKLQKEIQIQLDEKELQV